MLVITVRDIPVKLKNILTLKKKNNTINKR